ncbi:integral membrane protein PTH11 [Fusarium heterosporum]|uniref:Integral membrane protein PTH11 n=1 Tax=Fusarium heterosporum TaxID=42747 RepID=A0A8H5U280_FUSHE|nr:integral membrane protein PTH11 [Fusarium heterosporum]
MGTITAIIVALRFFAKLHYERVFRLDDYLVAFSFVLNVSNTVLCIYGLSGNGLGTDTWKSSPDTITDFLMYLYIGQTFYASDVFVTKICVLLFYLRIFPVVSVRRVLWGTIAVAALFFWRGWDKLHEGEGKCIGVNALGWAIAAVSIILDVWVLAIPLSQIVRLQMKWKRKLAVGLMFVVGTFVTIVSILRLRYLVAFGKSTNPLWDSFNTVYWSDIEINVAIWCVCMPDLRMVIRQVFPSLRSSLGSNDAPKGSNPTSGKQGRSTNSSSYHTHENIYKAKPAQRHGDDEPSSSTADLVELSTLTSRHETRSLV